MKISATNPLTFKFYEFFQSKLGGPAFGRKKVKKNKIWEATGILIFTIDVGGGGLSCIVTIVPPTINRIHVYIYSTDRRY
jgi:hypothetical protein